MIELGCSSSSTCFTGESSRHEGNTCKCIVLLPPRSPRCTSKTLSGLIRAGQTRRDSLYRLPGGASRPPGQRKRDAPPSTEAVTHIPQKKKSDSSVSRLDAKRPVAVSSCSTCPHVIFPHLFKQESLVEAGIFKPPHVIMTSRPA